MEAIILAGGLGTRLRGVVSDQPKVLAPIAGRPFLEYLFDYLIHCGVRRVILSVGFKKEQIEKRYTSRYQNLPILYCREEVPLGTGGAIEESLSFCTEDEVFILNGDSIFLVSLESMKEFHAERRALATLAVRKVPQGGRFGTVVFETEGRIVQFQEKKIAGESYINGGVYLVERKKMQACLKNFSPPFSIETEIFPSLLPTAPSIYAYPADAFFIDIGTPESFEKAQKSLPDYFPLNDL